MDANVNEDQVNDTVGEQRKDTTRRVYTVAVPDKYSEKSPQKTSNKNSKAIVLRNEGICIQT